MAVVFVEIGQEVHITGGLFEDAVSEGVRQGYTQGRLRCSVAADPIRRGNTGDNTPAVIHLRLVPGDKLTITAAPKVGSENIIRIKMFTPSANVEDIIAFVAETVQIAGGNPCPPVVLGVGIGGDFEKCALLAKQALCRPVSQRNADRVFHADLEQRMLEEVNELNVGPQGFGGLTTVLAVNIEQFPTHIAGLPVAVNVGCHVTRHKKIII